MTTRLGQVLAPTSSPRPMPRPQAQQDLFGMPVRGKTEQGFSRLMGNPAMQAMMLQTAASLLGQQGIAASFGQGLGAAGRAAAADAQLARQREQETYERQQEAQAQAMRAASLRGGGGGGSGSGEGETDPDDLASRDSAFQEALSKWKSFYVEELDGYDPAEAEEFALIDAMREAGMFQALDVLSGMTEENGYTPQDRQAFLARMSQGPSAERSFFEAIQAGQEARTAELRDAANETPNPGRVSREGPTAPALNTPSPRAGRDQGTPQVPNQTEIPGYLPGGQVFSPAPDFEAKLRRAAELTGMPELYLRTNPFLVDEILAGN